LNLEQIKKACEICSRNGADFIMTSTGTKNNSLEFDKVEYIRNNIPEYMKIKIAGGIRTLQDVEKYYKLIDRVGTSVILKNNNATNE
jgi:deoxyribose-phosphate aldolase